MTFLYQKKVTVTVTLMTIEVIFLSFIFFRFKLGGMHKELEIY